MDLTWGGALSFFVLVEKITLRGFWAAKVGGISLVSWGGWIALSGGAQAIVVLGD